ncbi:Receptor expression-enhancing protein 6 [Paragonimus heterotremus]|uniref:Receptor expression-enhancing protein n=1 Tax=Paragonimus heterotremus TaxID=100268 RepID=A0A8J4SU63_9TREM|nr:Receptor expression-enhancing protein 6 [Paragonimus heterotremus]
MFGSLGRQLEDELKRPGPINDLLSFCEEKSGIDRRYIVYCGILLLCIYLLIGYGTGALVLVIGFIYPAYESVKAIESPSKDDDTQWLIYWVVFASLQLFETCTLSLIYYFPLYPLIKCLFLLYCMAPVRENGSTFIYNHVIRPLFLKHSAKIDSALDKAVDLAGNLVEENNFQKFRGLNAYRPRSLVGRTKRVCVDCGRFFDSLRGLSSHRRVHKESFPEHHSDC